jgi:uncharacterized membrane protein YphA (DoxX/SURF4 family)
MMALFIRLGRILLGVVFVYAAYTKLHQPWELFALSIDSYRLLPSWAVIAVSRSLPWLEMGIGVLLMAGLCKRTAAISASALLLLFFAIMMRAYLGEMNIDCGCFGIGQALGPMTLLRDALLAVLSLGVTLGTIMTRREAPKKNLERAVENATLLPPPGSKSEEAR